MVREISLVVLLHDIHCEAAQRLATPEASIGEARRAQRGNRSRRVLPRCLFANIGELVMLAHEEMHGRCGVRTSSTPKTWCGEHDAFGFDHGALGAAMLSEVDFPSEVWSEIHLHPAVGSRIWTAEHLAASSAFGDRSTADFLSSISGANSG